jgi:hypothetical protein
MKLIVCFGRFVALLCKNPLRHLPDAEFDAIDPWATEEQWLASLPASWSEPVGWGVGWGWWRAH